MARDTITTIIIESPPFSQIDGKEGVDLALVCAAFDHQVKLIFVDQGIFHLLNNQDSTYFSDKSHDKQLKALSFYDIESIYAEQESLKRFAVAAGSLLSDVQIISSGEVNMLTASSHQTVTF